MAVKFTTCYPILPQGGKTPCGVAVDRQSGFLQEIICPELSESVCANLAAKWNAGAVGGDKRFEDELAQFISDELKQIE